ncbi:MAG: hypothetical protein IJD18_03150 [Clostridia bacterium]|nr:hypothetical protein [Clostridia bacterium]
MKEGSINLNLARTAVIGCPGSGKTTLATQMATILGRPVVHLDKILLKANWQLLPSEERRQIVEDIVLQDQWLIDGMWRSNLEQRFVRATTVVLLDFGTLRCLWRVVARSFKYRKKQRHDLAEGCFDNFDGEFLGYVVSFRRKVLPSVLQLAKRHPNVNLVVLKNNKQVQKFLQQIQQSTSKPN